MNKTIATIANQDVELPSFITRSFQHDGFSTSFPSSTANTLLIAQLLCMNSGFALKVYGNDGVLVDSGLFDVVSAVLDEQGFSRAKFRRLRDLAPTK